MVQSDFVYGVAPMNGVSKGPYGGFSTVRVNMVAVFIDRVALEKQGDNAQSVGPSVGHRSHG